jgi:cyclomaltodextrinase / maltogenic alpha-amylase / neopullulanase
VGDPGGNDPDNRRMMRFNNLQKHEENTRAITKKLVTLRRNNLALMYGDWQVLTQADEHLVVKRKYFSNEVVVAFNKSDKPVTLTLADNTKDLKPTFSGAFSVIDDEKKLTLAPFSFEILTNQQP